MKRPSTPCAETRPANPRRRPLHLDFQAGTSDCQRIGVPALHCALPRESRDAIRKAFISEFRQKENDDGGLEKAVDTIERFLMKAEADDRVPLVRHNAGGRNVGGGSSTMGTFLLILAGIFGVLLVLRLVGGLFGRQRTGYPGQTGGMGMIAPARARRVEAITAGQVTADAVEGSSRGYRAGSAVRRPVTGSMIRCLEGTVI